MRCKTAIPPGRSSLPAPALQVYARRRLRASPLCRFQRARSSRACASSVSRRAYRGFRTSSLRSTKRPDPTKPPTSRDISVQRAARLPDFIQERLGQTPQRLRLRPQHIGHRYGLAGEAPNQQVLATALAWWKRNGHRRPPAGGPQSGSAWPRRDRGSAAAPSIWAAAAVWGWKGRTSRPWLPLGRGETGSPTAAPTPAAASTQAVLQYRTSTVG